MARTILLAMMTTDAAALSEDPCEQALPGGRDAVARIRTGAAALMDVCPLRLMAAATAASDTLRADGG